MPRASDRPRPDGAKAPDLVRARGRLRDEGGFSLVEAMVGVALFSLLFLGIMTIWTAGWKTESKARIDSEFQSIARNTMNVLLYGETWRDPPIHGLFRAKSVVTSTALSALSYEVVWYEKINETTTVIHDEAISYYLSGEKLYRYVEDPYVAPLDIVTSGGTEVADHVLAFDVTPDGIDPYPVGIVLRVGRAGGETIVLETTVTPRNMGLGD